jgi:large subunit GTPase 1
MLTPYERNLEVWRQLWRVVERSDFVFVILDSRNPLMFRSLDLETYINSSESSCVGHDGKPHKYQKRAILLLNKVFEIVL